MAEEAKTEETPVEPPKRKRGRPTKAEAEARKAAEAAAAAASEQPEAEQAAPAKRTRKTAAKKTAANAAEDAKEPQASADASADEAPAPKKKRGRPKKSDVEAAAAEADQADKADSSKADTKADGAGEDKADKDKADKADERTPKRSVKVSAAPANNNQSNNNQNNQNNNNQNNNHNGRNRNRNRRNRNDRNREYVPSVSREELEELKLPELREKAAELNIDASGMKKADMVEAIYKALAIAEGFLEVGGILDILQDGYGFLRTDGYLPGEHDVYVGLSTIRRNGLRKGDLVTGQTRPAREGEKFAAIQKVLTVNGIPIDELGHRPKFSELTPVFPDERLLMEHGKNTTTARVIDLAAPIGKGQRGLIVSPPKAGKTTVLKDIAAAITANNPEAHLMYLGIDERPEEATDMERSIKGEVVSSTFDMPSENHIQVAELVIERAKRLVEQGKDVVILLDSITRLARAYNLAQPASGRVLSGGVDSTALYPPKRFLGAARNIEHGGSLTILASALIDTGSKMDEVIFEEFKGTGNMELRLDRNLADRRIFPAIDPITSGTRKEELLLDPQEAPLIWAVRRILANMNNTERAMDMLIKSLKQTDTNAEFLLRTAKKAQTHQGRTDENFEF